jgi:Ras-related GTP-binding protein A/B
VRFLGDLTLNLWDCGGQDSFMDSYLTTQRSTIFQHVGVLIYVFDVDPPEFDARIRKDGPHGSLERPKDPLEYYRECLDGLRQYSPTAEVFLLIHKMDLVREPRAVTYQKKRDELIANSGDVPVTVFGTSIYDESLYKVRCDICFSTFKLTCRY